MLAILRTKRDEEVGNETVHLPENKQNLHINNDYTGSRQKI